MQCHRTAAPAGEREANAKKQQKAAKKEQKEAAKGIPATNKTIKKKSKFQGVRIRKGVTVKVCPQLAPIHLFS